ncbi:MAG: hypothetical protein KID00_00965 [Clostridium argentinense]|nr:hypothetical protein [Clostridium argentinense]
MIKITEQECVDYIAFLQLSIRQDYCKYKIVKDESPEYAKEIVKNQHKTYIKLLKVIDKYNIQQDKFRIGDVEISDYIIEADKEKIYKLRDQAWKEYVNETSKNGNK